MQLSSMTRLMLFTLVCAIVMVPLLVLADDGRPGIPVPQPTLAEYDIIVADGASQPAQNESLACDQAKNVALQIARVAYSYQTQVLRVRHTSSPTITTTPHGMPMPASAPPRFGSNGRMNRSEPLSRDQPD